MTNSKISIIIPCYNVEQYLRESLNSVINQTFKDIEIICVNDGSTDNSLSVLEEYAKTDKRIKIISQENQGVSVARNNGIKNATSEYITFLDPDDSYKENLCELVVKKIEQTNADIIAWGHENKIDDKFESNDYIAIQEILNGDNSIEKWLDLQIYIWEKAFKKSFLERNNILFPENIKNAEDVVFCLMNYFSGAKYALIPEALYNYSRIRRGKQTMSNQNGIANDIKAFKYFIETDIFKKLNIEQKTKAVNFFIRGAIDYYINLREMCDRHLYKDLVNYKNEIDKLFTKSERKKINNYRRINYILSKDKYIFSLKLKSAQKHPSLSIITICLNEKNLEQTCRSIVNQTYQDFEWIVIDGGSDEKTQNIYNKYKNRIDIFVSEQDNGVYDAMNKGIKRASGDYLLFMNAGDTIYDNTTLEQIIKYGLDKDIVYGNVLYHFNDNKVELKVHADILNEWFFISDSLNHQSMFIKRILFEKYGLFNEKYKIVADYDRWINFIYKKHRSYKHLNLIIANYDMNGISSLASNYDIWMKERNEVIDKYFPSKVVKDIRHNNYLKYNLGEQIYSLKNTPDKKHKVISLLGLRIKFRRKQSVNIK